MKVRNLSLLLLLTVGCSTNLPNPQLLDRLRVLAIVTDTPEVLPGAAVSLQLLVSDVRGGGRALSYTAEACTDPGLAYGVEPSCDHDAAKQTLASTAIALTPPQYTDLIPAFSVAVPSDLPDPFNGANYLVLVTVTSSDGEDTSAYRRIRVSGATKTPKNQNPSLTGFAAEDGITPIATLPTVQTKLRATPSPTATETYSYLKPDGSFETRTENTTLRWYASTGGLDANILTPTSPVEFTPSSNLNYAPFIITIISDERGGTSFLRLDP